MALRPVPKMVVRVLPDIVGIDKTFDYAVPDAWHGDGRAQRLRIGSIVRVRLGGRRVRGWVTQVGVDPEPGIKLAPLDRFTGAGPPAEIMDLAAWAAWRWAGRQVTLLRAASPPRAVAAPTVVSASSATVRADSTPSPNHAAFSDSSLSVAVPAGSSTEAAGRFDDLFKARDAPAVLRMPPAANLEPVAQAAARRGDALIITPSAAQARRLAAGLRTHGVNVALGPDDWAGAAAGATVVGTRAAVWLPMPRLASVVVFDEHSESLKSQQAPCWHAREVALERARRACVPAVLVSPIPSPEALASGRLIELPRSVERDGWPVVEVLDRRREQPTRVGPFAQGLRPRLSQQGRVAAVLNRKGRARLLACKSCGELVRSADGGAPMRLEDAELVSPDGSERRPAVCAACGSTVLRNLRMGVTRAREELEALLGEPVGEVTAESAALGGERVMMGTEALLWRLGSAASVVFLDFDQELFAPRQRSAEQAMALLARAARLLGGRRGDGRLIIQTRQPDHPVIRAAVHADPSILVAAESQRRRSLGLSFHPPQAVVSGEGAEGYVEALRSQARADTTASPEVAVLGPSEGRYLLRSERHEPLLDLLAATPRPSERVRIEVDPLRI